MLRLIQGKGLKVKPHVRAMVVPGSQSVRRAMIEKGYDKVFTDAGFEFREAGCSMCLAMNPDKLKGREVCASSSNRNFKGRQGSPTGRTLLMSPAMVAAAAIAGEVTDARELFGILSSWRTDRFSHAQTLQAHHHHWPRHSGSRQRHRHRSHHSRLAT